jgi:hypothetical protein
VYFYVEDGTMEIIESKQENRGIVQGRFLRRSKVAKPGTSSSYYEIDDLKIGSQVEIYSRSFHISSCNESTREFVMVHHGWDKEDVQLHPLPRDRFAETKVAKSKVAKSSHQTKTSNFKVLDQASTLLNDSFDAASKLIVRYSEISLNF